MEPQITISENTLLLDDNLLCSLKLKKYNVSLYLLYQGSDFLAYHMFVDGQLVFSGNHYRPTHTIGIETLESIVGCLAFLTIQEGDTDKKYFESYTHEQLAFSRSHNCRVIKYLIFDFEDKEQCNFHKEAKKIFKKGYKVY